VKRIGRDRFLRNVMIAMGNSGDHALADDAARAISDPSPVVAGAAIWALGELDPDRARALRPAQAADPHLGEEWDAIG
jgi:epoxyqueuosine reductase